MTLMNGLIHNRRAYLWTDTRLYHPETGATIGEGAKAFEGVAWTWAAVHTGALPLDDAHVLKRRITERWPIGGEALLAAAIDALRLEAEEGRIGRLLIAYPCEEYGARMFHIANDAMPFAAAYEPYETVELMSSGNGEPWAAQFSGRDMAPADMRRFIDYQVETPSETVFGWTGLSIGGNVIEIEVSAEGVESRVVRAVEGHSALAA
jgi:hypothetical protein